jgi:glycopeptide antibiotics resistance protein
MQLNKQKIFEVLLTALISAGIAFLQSLATTHFFDVEPVQTATVAGVLGGAIRSCRV